MNVAITGACGLLGAHLAAALSARHRVVGFDRHPWWGTRPIKLHHGDLSDNSTRETFLADAEPDLLIHCAANVNVDACEERPAEAYFSNGFITGLLVRAVPTHCRIVYVTTDGIFSGDTPMRRETDLPCPRTVYGRSKLHGEWETQLGTPNHLIVRTNFYGWSAGIKGTFAEWLYNALVNAEPVTLFDDFWFTPIYVPDLVDSILGLVAGGNLGIFHVVGSERVSKYEFGLHLARAMGTSTTNIRRGSIANAKFKARRPYDMSLESKKSAAALGKAPAALQAGLQRFVSDRERTLEERVKHLSSSWTPL